MDEIIIVEHNPQWKSLFEQEAKKIRQTLPHNLLICIEHFGSTAIPGLVAKPIIDLLVGVNSLHEAKEKAVAPLESLSYAFWRDNPDPLRMFFAKGLPPNGPRTHHVHIVEPDSMLWERLIFRDYLREHPNEAAKYAQLKYALALDYKYDREAYTAGKTEYIKSVMQKAKL